MQTCTIFVFVKLLSWITLWAFSCTIILMTYLSPQEKYYVVLVDIHLFGNGPPYPWPPFYVTVNRTKVHDSIFNSLKQWKPDVVLKHNSWVLDLFGKDPLYPWQSDYVDGLTVGDSIAKMIANEQTACSQTRHVCGHDSLGTDWLRA